MSAAAVATPSPASTGTSGAGAGTGASSAPGAGSAPGQSSAAPSHVQQLLRGDYESTAPQDDVEERVFGEDGDEITGDGGDQGDVNDSREAAGVQKPNEQAAAAAASDEDLARLGKEYDLNPADPRDRAILQKIATNAAKASPAADEQVLTDFEKDFLKVDAGAEADQAGQGATQQGGQADAFKFGDAGDNWNGFKDAYQDIEKAWEARDGSKPETLDRVNEVETALFRRRFELMFEMAMQRRFPDLGQVVAHSRSSRQVQSQQADHDLVMGQLANTPVGASISEMMKPTSDKTIKWEGDEYPDTPLNRIIRENPFITRIRFAVGDVYNGKRITDGQFAQRLTIKEQLTAATKIYQRQGTNNKAISPETARDLVDAGRKMEARNGREASRAAINRGGGASGGSAQPGGGSHVQSLLRGGGGGRPQSKYFS